MELRRNGVRHHVILTRDPPVNRHRPSVDVMLRSVAQYPGANSLGIILTGMVFGMPKEATKAGGVDKVLPLSDIPTGLLTHLKCVSR